MAAIRSIESRSRKSPATRSSCLPIRIQSGPRLRPSRPLEHALGNAARSRGDDLLDLAVVERGFELATYLLAVGPDDPAAARREAGDLQPDFAAFLDRLGHVGLEPARRDVEQNDRNGLGAGFAQSPGEV